MSIIYLFIYRIGDDLDWVSHGVQSTEASESPKSAPSFGSRIGPTSRTKSAKTPLAVFCLFLTASLLQSIVTQTNLYASYKLDLQLEELEAFIGMNIAMGMLWLPQVCEYWAMSAILSIPWFSSVMPRDRFFPNNEKFAFS